MRGRQSPSISELLVSVQSGCALYYPSAFLQYTLLHANVKAVLLLLNPISPLFSCAGASKLCGPIAMDLLDGYVRS